MLLGCKECTECERPEIQEDEDGRAKAYNSIFGWIVGGSFPSDGKVDWRKVICCNKTNPADTELSRALQAFWKVEDTQDGNPLRTEDENIACAHFADTHTRNEEGRYRVALPRTTPVPELGESRRTAVQRFVQNEKSLRKRGKWDQFKDCLDEYLRLGHAELVPPEDLNKPPKDVFYLPTHGVAKDSSTTTKLKIVYDASAKTASGVSLNDQLLPGPSLYPLLPSILLNFRFHQITLSADISKMFREIELHLGEKDYHRFLVKDGEDKIVDARMKRLTYGVKSSPFLATKVLRQMASDHRETYPKAAEIVESRFYVDDCLSGAETIEEAIQQVQGLCELCKEGGMNLRKFRTSSTELRKAIPPDLLEKSDLKLIPSRGRLWASTGTLSKTHFMWLHRSSRNP